MRDVLVLAAIILGTLFLTLASLAAARLHDPYVRLSAATKAVTFGSSAVLAGSAIFFFGEAAMTRSLAGIAFFMVTAPVAAHVLARQAHRSGIPLWHRSIADELQRDLDLVARGPGTAAEGGLQPGAHKDTARSAPHPPGDTSRE